MGIFNIKSLKDKYAWGSSEDKTNSAETTEEHPATVASSSANIADGVRSLIKSNPDLAGKNRRGVAGRTITPAVPSPPTVHSAKPSETTKPVPPPR